MRLRSMANVYLIGAGPGDPGLFTLKGKKCMKQADVIIYDYLANRRLLEFARPDAEIIFVGKKGFSEHVTQDQINELLVKKALSPDVSHVARLKGGDPFVFGRGGEEALALAERGISFEVVPGVTSGVAAPAYAGIPVTHRGLASSVAFITGHEDPTKNSSAIHWDYLAKGVDTLCFYMGIRALPTIAERLIHFGRSEQTPVALVRWGTTSSQEVLVSTLAKVAEDAQRAAFEAPAIIIVGDVVSMRDQIPWFENHKPLLGKKIVVTRSRTQASSLVEELENRGAQVFEFPTISIEHPESYDALDRSISRISHYQWIAFTSVNGVEHFFMRLKEAKKDARAFAGLKVAAIGPATAKRLEDYGIVADVVPSEYRAEGVIDSLVQSGIRSGDNLLLPRALVARDILPDELRKKGISVDVVAAYETKLDCNGLEDELVQKLKTNEIDVITFASSSTVRNFVELITRKHEKSELMELMNAICVASIGPITTETAESLGINVPVEAQEYTIAGLVRELEQAIDDKK